MNKMVSGLTGLVLATGIGMNAANAQDITPTNPNYDRTRLATQPEVGEASYEGRRIGWGCSIKTGVRLIPATNGRLLYKSDETGDIKLEDGKPKNQPFGYYDAKLKELFINVDGDATYDFMQKPGLEHPCQILNNLTKYKVK